MSNAEHVDQALTQWQQGDIFLDFSLPFLHVIDAQNPLSQEASEEAESEPPQSDDDNLRAIGTEVFGFAILSQTCDIVLPSVDRPYVELAPLLQVNADYFAHVERGHVPRYVTLSSIAEQLLVVDLDRVMTVEKSVLALVPSETHTTGCKTDDEKRLFAYALSRKRTRVAFPDSFVAAVDKIRRRVRGKHDKNSPEGDFLRRLREIRVATANWNAEVADTIFWFILRDEEIGTDVDQEQAAKLLERFEVSGKYPKPDFRILSMVQISAAAYEASDRLDLSYLSE